MNTYDLSKAMYGELLICCKSCRDLREVLEE